jgi:frataxin-like iron-binding protein CyaY
MDKHFFLGYPLKIIVIKDFIRVMTHLPLNDIETLFNTLEDICITYEEKEIYEVDRNGNHLMLKTADHQEVVIHWNEHVQELWLASKKTGGVHFKKQIDPLPNPNVLMTWYSTRDQSYLKDVLHECFPNINFNDF